MSLRQLRIDLHERTRERTRLLICDTFELYEMAELEPSEAVTALADVLMKETAHVLATSTASAEIIGTAVAAMVRFQRGEISHASLNKLLQTLGRAAEASR